MEGYSRKEDHKCPQLLDLNEEYWVVKEKGHGVSEEKKLELRLGPPGGEWTTTDNNSYYGYFSNNPCAQNPAMKSPWRQHQQGKPHFLRLQQVSVMKKQSQPCNDRVDLQSAENTAVPNTTSAQKRTAPGPVVGWPPVRSFRKNIASGSNSSSSKSASESPDHVVLNKVPNQKTVVENNNNINNNNSKGLFVKINMDGIPIGRKVDLKACDSYVKLCYVVDELFRDLIEAQNDTSGIGKKEKEGGGKVAIGGLLDGSGEYTLVYEDNEGDRMLVGDVPWHMFISTVKRLRVLKSSELPTLSRGSKQGKLS